MYTIWDGIACVWVIGLGRTYVPIHAFEIGMKWKHDKKVGSMVIKK